MSRAHRPRRTRAAVADRHRLASAVLRRLRRAQLVRASDARGGALAPPAARRGAGPLVAVALAGRRVRRNPYATGWALATHGSEASEAPRAACGAAQCAANCCAAAPLGGGGDATRWRGGACIGADDPRTSRALAGRRRGAGCGAARRSGAGRLRCDGARCSATFLRAAQTARAERKSAVARRRPHAGGARRAAAARGGGGDARRPQGARGGAVRVRRRARASWPRARWRRAAAALRARLRQEVARLRQPVRCARRAGAAARLDARARAYSAAGELRSPARGRRRCGRRLARS